MPTEQIAVLGAGAAGLWAAARAARRGARVLLLEKTTRTGTKILASGGTRCNLTTTLDAGRAAALFGRAGERFLRTAFDLLPPARLRALFETLGVPTEEAPLEKVFPRSARARDVRDALERETRAGGVRLRLGAPVAAIEPGDGGWRVHLTQGAPITCRRLILCTGGRSYPGTGTTGDGYDWLRALDLEVVAPIPALVPLTSPAPWVRELSGVAWQGGAARLLDASGRVLGRRARPLLFTHRGISGPAAMDLSRHVARRPGDSFELQLDLFPDISREELRARLIEVAGRPGQPSIARAFPRALPRRLLLASVRAAELGDRIPRANALARAARHRLVEALKALPVPVDGTLGFEAAEVTAGGLALRELDPRTMEVNRHRGLYVCGEILDLDGPIGGLNFQAAFATAEVAARAAAP